MLASILNGGRKLALAITVVVVALGLLAGGLVVYVNRIPAHVRTPGTIAIFDSGVPGSNEATAALDFASAAHIDVVINYSAINAAPAAIAKYLDDAQMRGVKVAISLKDLLGRAELASDPALDQDPGDRELHQQFGATPDDQVREIVRRFDQHPAVWGYYSSDELPQDPNGDEGSAKWLGPLQSRYQLLKSLTQKPVMGAWYWGANRESFLAQMKTGVDDLMVDYYPFPDQKAGASAQSYGSVEDISQIGQTLSTVAGDRSWFGLQGFSWTAEPETAERFNFGDNPPAPNADWMVYMAQLALQGGARNLAFFSYGYAQATPGQLDEIKKAVSRIRPLPEFNR